MNTEPPSSSEQHLVISWGELVWDVFDDSGQDRSLGGCASNVAFHLARLGQRSALVSRVGSDRDGYRAIEFLEHAGVDCGFIQMDRELPTARVRVRLKNGEASYEMLARMDWAKVELTNELAKRLPSCGALVYGTLAQRDPLALSTLGRVWDLLSHGCLRVCDLNLRGAGAEPELVRICISQADVVKLNEIEYQRLATTLQIDDPIEWMLRDMDVSVVAYTLGGRGCELYDQRSKVVCPAMVLDGALRSIAQQPDATAIGAGDAFCASLVYGLLQGEPLDVLARRCNEYAARVVRHRGATL